MYIETWYKIACPKCDKPNWVCNGDVSDQTVSDVEAVECHSCNHQFVIGDEEDCDMENLYVEKGLEQLNRNLEKSKDTSRKILSNP